MVKKSHERPYTVSEQREPVPKTNKLLLLKPRVTTRVRLIKGSLRKNACKDRSGGAICGSVFEEITLDEIGRIVKSVCYPNKHERKLRKRKEK